MRRLGCSPRALPSVTGGSIPQDARESSDGEKETKSNIQYLKATFLGSCDHDSQYQFLCLKSTNAED